MFRQKYDEWMTRRALKKFINSDFGRLIHEHNVKSFNESLLGAFSNTTKGDILSNQLKMVKEIVDSPNPFMKMREMIADRVIQYAEWQVLAITQEEKSNSLHADLASISGELHNHLRDIAKHNEMLGSILHDNPTISDSDLHTFCNMRAAVFAYHVNTLNIVRIHFFRDCSEEYDWLRLFVQSMMVVEEFNIRSKLNMPSLLKDDIDYLTHNSFLNYVISGVEDPYTAWVRG